MNSKLIRGVQYAAWAYFFLYLDINLNRFSLLPNAVGWYLLSRAVTALEEEHPDLRLLGPLTFPLGLWALKQYAFLLPAWDLSQFSWLLSWLALAVELTTLYFHFQFLTDLADIAARHAGERRRSETGERWCIGSGPPAPPAGTESGNPDASAGHGAYRLPSAY